MSDEMPSWRAIARAASHSIKTYVSPRDFKRPFPAGRDIRGTGQSDRISRVQSWSQWAGQKLRRAANDATTVERLSLFPGWATRKYHFAHDESTEGMPFDVEVFVSGFASRSSGLGFSSRSGRAFLRLAKGFAALPKMAAAGAADMNGSATNSSTQLDDFPAPENSLDDIDEGAIVEALDDQIRHLDPLEAAGTKSTAGDTGPLTSSYASGSRSPSVRSSSSSNMPGPKLSTPFCAADLQRWHANLEARLSPFWSSALSSRTVRLSVYAADPTLFDSDDQLGGSNVDEDCIEYRPIVSRDLVTAPDGSFQIKFHVTWDIMCLHPAALQIAFGDAALEHDLFVVAELLPSLPSSTPTTVQPPLYLPYPSVTTSLSIPLTYSSIRLISDIDDTVKLSNVLSGARNVFHNVFVKDLRDSVIPEMGEWYNELWSRGVRFHYVSNGPFGLLPVLNEFFQLSHLPVGSMRLRSYAGRSLFSSLLSAPSARKRAGLIDVLDGFSNSRFILVGDSGEQDLELYASIAKERPEQILAVFIRDASLCQDSARDMKPLDDPTGAGIWRKESDVDRRPSSSRSSSQSSAQRTLSKYRVRSPVRSMSERPAPKPTTRKPARAHSADVLPTLNETSSGYFSPSLGRTSPVCEEPKPLKSPAISPVISRRGSLSSEPQSPRGQSPMLDSEKRRYDLQMRVYRARLEVPRHIPLRVFRQPEECVEAAAILDRLRV